VAYIFRINGHQCCATQHPTDLNQIQQTLDTIKNYRPIGVWKASESEGIRYELVHCPWILLRRQTLIRNVFLIHLWTAKWKPGKKRNIRHLSQMLILGSLTDSGCSRNRLLTMQMEHCVQGNTPQQNAWILHEVAELTQETFGLANQDTSRLPVSSSLYSHPPNKLVVTFGSSSPVLSPSSINLKL
jgi:hypothetical protein